MDVKYSLPVKLYATPLFFVLSPSAPVEFRNFH